MNHFFRRTPDRRGTARQRTRLSCELLEARTVPTLVGSPIQANTTTAGDQFHSTCASAANGMSLVVWDDWGTGISSRILKARLFDANHGAVADEFTVFAGNGYYDAAAAMDANGNFVIAWWSDFDGTEGIDFARYDATGQLLGTGNIPDTLTRINTYPDVAMSAAGSFVIANSQGKPIGYNGNVVATMFQADGTFVRTINVAKSTANEFDPAVACAADGRFSVSYTKGNTRTSNLKLKLFLQRYSTEGTLVGKHKLAAQLSEFPQADVSMDDSGNALVGWHQYDHTVQDFLGERDIYSLRMRSVTATGQLSAAATLDPDLHLDTVSLALDRTGSGSFVAAGHAGAGFHLIEVTFADGDYTPDYVLTDNTGSQTFNYGGDPIVSIDGNGGYVMAVPSNQGSLFESDGDDWGVFAQFGQLA